MPKCIILQGIPNSGKSTWANKQYGFIILSCDNIRYIKFGKEYKFSPWNEKMVWDDFYDLIEIWVYIGRNIIIDNTNLKQAYINQIMCRLTDNYEVEIKRFDVSLWKAHLRNIIRRVKTGKWIPIKVIKAMYNNYKKLEK